MNRVEEVVSMNIEVMLDIDIDDRRGSWLGEEAVGGVEGVEDENGIEQDGGQEDAAGVAKAGGTRHLARCGSPGGDEEDGLEVVFFRIEMVEKFAQG